MQSLGGASFQTCTTSGVTSAICESIWRGVTLRRDSGILGSGQSIGVSSRETARLTDCHVGSTAGRCPWHKSCRMRAPQLLAACERVANPGAAGAVSESWRLGSDGRPAGVARFLQYRSMSAGPMNEYSSEWKNNRYTNFGVSSGIRGCVGVPRSLSFPCTKKVGATPATAN